MTTYTLTINTDELGLGVIDGGKVVVTRRRATAADQYPPVSALYEITTATNGSGVATASIKADDSSTYHVCRVWDADGALVFQVSFAMPPEASDLHNLSEAVIGASNIQFQDEGANRGAPSTVRTVNFTGNAVSATFASETLTVNITKPTTAADVSADAAGTASSAVAAHVAAADPHGDRAYADSLVTGLWDDRGNYDASGGAYPSTGGSGTAGAIKKGDIWTISVAGTLPTAQTVEPGDTVRALVDTPGQTQGNWAIAQNNIGYTPESAANKSTDTSLGDSDTLYPSQKAVKDYVLGKLDTRARITLDYKFYPSTQVTPSSDPPFVSGGSAFAPVSPYVTNATLADITNSAQAATAYKFGMTSTVSGASSGIVMRDVPGHDGNSAKPLWNTGDKFEFIFSVAFQDTLPGVSHDFAYRVGVADRGLSVGLGLLRADPFAVADAAVVAQGFAAYFDVDNTSGYIVCRSGYRAVESTTTAVDASLNLYYTFKITIGTNGVVYFYIDGNLVATHSTGIAVAGCAVVEMLGIYNKAATSAGTKSVVINRIAKRYAMATITPGFVFD